MPYYRSRTTTFGRHMAGARALWRATGMTDEDFSKPIIAICNSYTQFVPGHIHLQEVGALVASAIKEAGGVAKEFNTIAIDDGIAMGHSGMLYSLPSRELIADSVEYMVNAHCADALVCLSNCDKITPGMLMAALRLNLPTIFVSGGPMEAGKLKLANGSSNHIDLVDAITTAADDTVDDAQALAYEQSACPTCGSCSGMFTANSMNCLTEALGLALPGNGTLLATHAYRKKLFLQAGRQIVALCKSYYEKENLKALPRNIANKNAFENAMMLDIAMGGSTNTILHLLAAAQEAEVNFTLQDIDRLSRKIPHLCKVAPSTNQYHMEDVHRAGGVMAILGELHRAKLLHEDTSTVLENSFIETINQWDIYTTKNKDTTRFYAAGPAGVRTTKAYNQNCHYPSLDLDRSRGCIRNIENAYSREGGLAVLYGNLAPNGCVVKTAGVAKECLTFRGKAKIFESQEEATEGILKNHVHPGEVVLIRYEGPKGGPGMQEMLYPTSSLKAKSLDKQCALLTDGRFSGGTSGLSIGHISPEAANGGTIALVEENDWIEIDIPKRTITLCVSEKMLSERRNTMKERGVDAWKPRQRQRHLSTALKTYAFFAQSADKGATRKVDHLKKDYHA